MSCSTLVLRSRTVYRSVLRLNGLHRTCLAERRAPRALRQRYLYSTEAAPQETKAATDSAGSSSSSMSMRAKVGLFAAFIGVGGGLTFAYMLSTDPDFLFQVRDYSPRLVNTIAPFIGLPVEESTGELDVEAFAPRNIQEIVGDTLKIACVLRSGRIVLVDAPADANAETLQRVVDDKVGSVNDPIVQFDFVNAEEEEAISKQSDEDLQKFFGIKIPEIPANATKQQLKDILDQCRFLESDLIVQRELSLKYQNDITQIIRALEQTEERKKQIKALLKKR